MPTTYSFGAKTCFQDCVTQILMKVSKFQCECKQTNVAFLHSVFGLYVDPFDSERLFVKLEAGFTGNVLSEVDGAEEADFSSLGEVEGVAFSKEDDWTKIGKGFGGPYLQVGLSYIIH